MKAWRFTHFDDGFDGLRIGDEPEPELQRGEVKLRVRAVSLNYRDVAMPLGKYPAPNRPGHIPTSDAVASVVAIGEGVRGLAVGDRVVGAFHRRWFGGRPPADWSEDGYGALEDGWLAEYKVLGAESVVRVPDAIGDEDAATLPCAATTAWTALAGPKPIRAGDSVLTLGSGGVSVFAVQLAKLLGATVFATTSSGKKAEKLRALGADHVVNYVETPDWGAQVRALTGGRGVDRVVENGGAGTIVQSLAAVAEFGEVALIGFLSDGDGTLPFMPLFGSGAATRSIRVGSRTELQDLVQAVAVSGLKPAIDRVFSFDEAPAAFRHLASGEHVGKVVIRVA